MIKIISGKYKRSNLIVHDKYVRPTSLIKRESIFSVIESYAVKNNINLYNNKAALDIFAGSGALGLEAFSRGISKIYFYENNVEVVKILKNNCSKICSQNDFEIFEDDVILFPPKKISAKISIIFIDPPYNKYDIKALLNSITKIIDKNTIIVIEFDINQELTILEKLKIIEEKKYKKTIIYFLKLID